MLQPFRLARSLTLLLLVITTYLLLTVNPASARDSSLGTAADSPIAVPFVGDYEVWCTDRNPAPGNLCSRHHGSPAIDLGMDPGTPLFAVGAGVVIEADAFCGTRGWCNNGKGNSVIVEHADGSYSRYLHLASVSVALDQLVEVGEPIGTSGESGQSSSPHLHYDEHFPFGTRTDMGQWVGCVNGQQVRYPDVLGTSDWNEVPYGSRIVNHDYDCLAGVDLSTVAQPRILPGTTHFGVTPPSSKARTWFEVSIDLNDGAGPTVTQMAGTAMIYLPAPKSVATIAVRERVGGVWQRWSSPLEYSSGTADGPTCYGLTATVRGTMGTPDADVIIGTPETDHIDARGGHDVICSGAGDDTILAGLGNDVIFAGTGNDTVSGGMGHDIIWAQAGQDNVRGGDGPDMIHGGSDDDLLHGTGGNDYIEGGNGDDTLIGGIGHDVLRAGADNDTLEGRNGRDNLGGGNGIDSNDGGNGNDRCLPDVAGNKEVLIGCER